MGRSPTLTTIPARWTSCSGGQWLGLILARGTIYFDGFEPRRTTYTGLDPNGPNLPQGLPEPGKALASQQATLNWSPPPPEVGKNAPQQVKNYDEPSGKQQPTVKPDPQIGKLFLVGYQPLPALPVSPTQAVETKINYVHDPLDRLT